VKYYKAGIVFFVAFLVQTTLLGDLFGSGVAPNLLLCLTVVFTFLYDESYGLVFGIVFGMLLDLSTQTIFGTQTLTFVLAAIPPLLLRQVFNPEKILPDVFVAVLATPINAFPVWWIYHLAGSLGKLRYVIDNLATLMVLHAVIALVLHLLLVRTIIRNRRDRRYNGGVR
jgi:rod shape-determining protein MreD